MEEVIINENFEEVEEIQMETEENEMETSSTVEDVPSFTEDSSFAPPTILIDGVTHSYYELAYREQIRSNALIMTTLIAIVSIFALTRFYRFFRSIFTVKI